MKSALAGVKVLDLSRFIAGPHCAMILGDMGADVIKIEKIDYGDDSRQLPPFQQGESLYVMALNRNKRSMTMNFRDKEAQDILRKMVEKCDVLIENFRPGTMEKMGCGWSDLESINPRLIMTRLSGFGQDGPYSQRPGFDAIAQAMSGLMSLTGPPDGAPFLAGTFYIDYMTAMYGVSATLAALHARQITGKGQMIDVALLDSAVSMLTTAIPSQMNQGISLQRMGNRDRYSCPANVFRSLDGDYIILIAGTNPLFERLTGMMEQPDLMNNHRYNTVDARIQHVDEVEKIVQHWIGAISTQKALTLLEDAGIPCAKIATIEEVVKNQQLHHRNQILETDHPVAGKINTAGVTMKLSGTPLTIRLPAPSLGQHTTVILREWLGMTQDKIAALQANGTV